MTRLKPLCEYEVEVLDLKSGRISKGMDATDMQGKLSMECYPNRKVVGFTQVGKPAKVTLIEKYKYREIKLQNGVTTVGPIRTVYDRIIED